MSLIHDVDLKTISLSPTGAEVLVTLTLQERQPEWEIRGKLHGPHNPRSTTIELAYPFRPVPGASEEGRVLQRRVIIPEVSLWEPDAPFLYTGTVEIRKNSQRLDRITFQYGFRELRLTRRGLFINAQSVELQGTRECPHDAEQAMELKQQGYNAVVLSTLSDLEQVLSLAERNGLLVLCELGSGEIPRERLLKLEQRPCFVGWICREREQLTTVREEVSGILGLISEDPETDAIPEGVRFLIRSTSPITIQCI